MSEHCRVVCLLPARNSAAELPGYLTSAARFADAVVALDDGSTDDTGAILSREELVRILLENPRRPTYEGWDDGENRRRLLAAAAELEPEWVVWMDADERLAEDDATVLRSFLETDALAGCAFGLQHFRMCEGPVAEELYCDPAYTWVYRVFAFRPGQELPRERLHFDPIPTGIPRSAYLGTTIRLQHFGSATDAGRRARLAKYRAADPEASYGVDFGGLAEPPNGSLQTWSPRRPGAPVLFNQPAAVLEGDRRGVDYNSRKRTGDLRAARHQRVVCLLPARNCEEQLPQYFESVQRFADAVVALDDGSTDGTRAAIRAQPLVRRLLTNRACETYRGWHDAENRNRLLRAAAELRPDWIMSLDADERIDADDAAALRDFVQGDALAGCAYGFRVFRMLEGLERYDQAGLWVYRLFRFEPGQAFSGEPLHGVPVPTAIPRERWLDTTFRIQHLAGLTGELRQRRYRKYLQADPDRRWQGSYEHLLAAPGDVKLWERRPARTGPLAHGDLRAAIERLDLDAPVLSAIVIAQNDEDRIERVVRAVVEQDCRHTFEVIVVTSGSDRTAEIVRDCFPQVKLIALPHAVFPGAARNAGLRAARGDYVSFPGSHVELPQGSLAARIDAHELGHVMVTGAVLNGTDTPSGWASYFLDHVWSLPGLPCGRLSGPPAHCSYTRDALLEVGGFPEGLRAGEDTFVNLELTRRGYGGYRAANVRLVHRSRCERPRQLVRHHFGRGRALARIRLMHSRHGGRLLTVAPLRKDLIGYIPTRLLSIAAAVRSWGDPSLREQFHRARPLVLLGVIAAWLGLWLELLRPRRGKLQVLLGRGGLTIVIAGLHGGTADEWPGLADHLLIGHIDRISRGAGVVSLPRELLLAMSGEGERLLGSAGHADTRHGPSDRRSGAQLLRAAVAEVCGLRVDHYAVVDRESFRRLVDDLGGVELTLEHPIEEPTPGGSDAAPDAARQRMAGSRALDYVRTRTTAGSNWHHRRQLEMLRALYAEVRSIRSPRRAWRVLRSARANVRASVGIVELLGVAAAAARLDPDRIATSLLPLRMCEPTTTVVGSSAVRARRATLHAFLLSALGLRDDEATSGVARSVPSPNFCLDEFACADGTAVPLECQEALAQLCRDYLEPMRERFGAAVVHAGYQTEAHNERVGGTVFSYHLYDQHPGCAAADVEFERGSPADWARFAEELGAGGIGLYERLRFVHVDTRAGSRRWVQR